MRAFHLMGPLLESLIRVDIPTPALKPDEVLLRMHAASLNYLDLLVAYGRQGHGVYPLVAGTDGAGEIAAVGSLVQDWGVGDRVVPGNMVDWHAGPPTAQRFNRLRGVSMDGSLADYAAVPAAALVKIPDAMSYLEAATLPIAATTAWNAIVRARIRPGSTVVLLGTGGVSLFALQFAKAAGARVIITSSSDEKLEKVRALGADEIINYRTTPAWDDAVLTLTDGHGADLLIETIGASTFPRSLNAAAINGTIFVVGFIGGTALAIPVMPIMAKSIAIVGNATGSTANLADTVRAVAAAHIKPVIDTIFGFEQAPDAYRYLESAGHVGKIAITFGN